jgi:hypothetical protein
MAFSGLHWAWRLNWSYQCNTSQFQPDELAAAGDRESFRPPEKFLRLKIRKALRKTFDLSVSFKERALIGK